MGIHIEIELGDGAVIASHVIGTPAGAELARRVVLTAGEAGETLSLSLSPAAFGSLARACADAQIRLAAAEDDDTARVG